MIKNEILKIKHIMGETVKEIALTNNFVFRAFEVYNGSITGEEFIKVSLPSKQETAIELLNNGIVFNEIEYVPFLSSPNMMKSEQGNFKCDYLFIRKEFSDFVEEYRNLFSLGNMSKLYNQEKVCINKDITARLSLGLSGSYQINYKPKNIVILGSDTYTHIADYYSVRDGQLVELNVSKEFELADGCGFMSDRMADIIGEQLKVDYRVDFAIIRSYNGLSTKGLVIRCNWNKYFEENYQQTEYFEKRADGFYTKDFFNNWVNISKADLVLNINMCKYAKLFKDEEFENINDFINKKIDKEFTKYKDVLQSLYVSKINKREPKQYTQINYQVLNNVALVNDELKQLQQPTFNYLKDIADGDYDKLRIMLGDLINEEKEDGAEVTAVTKVHRLLQLDKDNMVMKSIKAMTKDILFKKAHEVVCKPYIKGNYKYISIDPICYLNWIMSRDIPSSRELQEGQVFIPKETGHRVIGRNPLAVFSEVHQIKLSTTEKLERYFGHLTNELIFVNMADNLLFISSGADKTLSA